MRDLGRMINRTVINEGHELRRAIGLKLVRLTGRNRPDASDGFDGDLASIAHLLPITEPGTGTNVVDRLASVAPWAAGLGVLGTLAGYGSVDASGSPVMLGRVAQGPHDSVGVFADQRPHPRMDFTSQSGRSVDGLGLDVPVAANAPALLVALGFVTLKAATEMTTVSAQLTIGGTERPGDPSHENTDGSEGWWFDAGYSTQWHGLFIFHARKLYVQQDDQPPDGVPVRIGVNVKHDSDRGSSSVRGGSLLVVRLPG